MFKKGSKVVRKDGVVGEVIKVYPIDDYAYPVIVSFSTAPSEEDEEDDSQIICYTCDGRHSLSGFSSLDITLLEDENQAGKAEAKPFLVNKYNIDEGIALLEQAMLEVFFQEKRELILKEELEEKRTLVLKDDFLTCSQAENTCLWQAGGDVEILHHLEDRRRKYLIYKNSLISLTLTVEQVQLLIRLSLPEREKLIREFIQFSGKETSPKGYSMAGIMQWYETYCL